MIFFILMEEDQKNNEILLADTFKIKNILR